MVKRGVRNQKANPFIAYIEERFIAQKARDGAEYLSAQADAFTGSEREERASARSVRNDRLDGVRLAPFGMTGLVWSRRLVSSDEQAGWVASDQGGAG
jgi:hypothetical protein